MALVQARVKQYDFKRGIWECVAKKPAKAARRLARRIVSEEPGAAVRVVCDETGDVWEFGIDIKRDPREIERNRHFGWHPVRGIRTEAGYFGQFTGDSDEDSKRAIGGYVAGQPLAYAA